MPVLFSSCECMCVPTCFEKTTMQQILTGKWTMRCIHWDSPCFLEPDLAGCQLPVFSGFRV